ncbi:glycosyltransferase family 4 protein [Gephyromycinifex aptenodytis]|uniref:glycosyltransferase family 4 protein n=1 Tax=Gephyromycinifex aptenodytis TaxID=2716227 RepID=UPI001444FA62|nr:glycosyltransferase family 4 protein [Gephyromycinifex aptenodytis]
MKLAERLPNSMGQTRLIEDVSVRPLRVCLVGSAPASAQSRGGMASVMALSLRGMGPQVQLEHITTYRDTDAADRAKVGASGLARLAARLSARNVDVVHVHMSYKGSVARKVVVLRMAKAFGVPTVLHAHSHGFKAWFDSCSALTQRAIRRGLSAQRWIVLGEGLKREYVEMFDLDPDQVIVLRNPVPLRPAPQRAERGSDAPFQLLFLGRLGQRKGTYDLIAALARLPRELRMRTVLTLAGDGEIEEAKLAARRAGVEDQVVFPGWIDPAERARLLDQADAFVLPSYEEGLPMALLEAMSHGVPVLTCPVGGIGEVIRHGENGLLVTPGDVSALVEALTELSEPKAAARIGQAGWQTSTQFDVETWRGELVQLWTSLAS